jgi:hypothetical protein
VSIQVLEVQLGRMVDLHDFQSFELLWLLSFSMHGRCVLITREHSMQHRLAA